MSNQIRTVEELQLLSDKIAGLMNKLEPASLLNIEYISDLNTLLKQVERTGFSVLGGQKDERASALFRSNTHTSPSMKARFFEERLEAEIIRSAKVMRETVRQAALEAAMSRTVSAELASRLDSNGYQLNRSVDDLLEVLHSSEFIEEPQEQYQKERR